MKIDCFKNVDNAEKIYVILSDSNTELCRFTRLTDASLVYRFLCGEDMTTDMMKMAYSLIANNDG